MPTSLLVPGHQHAHTHTIILAWQVKALMDPLNRHQEPIRNSGHMGGRFSEKRRIKNPATGEYFKLSEPWLHSHLTMFPGLQSLNESLALLQNSISRGMVYTPQMETDHCGFVTSPSSGAQDLFVGQTVVIAAQPLRITRADEHCLQYLEARTTGE